MRRLLAFAFLLLATATSHAQIPCTQALSSSVACFSQASKLQYSDLLSAMQGTGPVRSPQSVSVTPMQVLNLYQATGAAAKTDYNVVPSGAYNQAARVNADTILGAGACPLLSSTSLDFNTCSGYFAGNLMPGDGSAKENTLIGYAPYANAPGGSFNTAVGNGAGFGINYVCSFMTLVGMDTFRGAFPETGIWNLGCGDTSLGAITFRNGNFTNSVAIGVGSQSYTNGFPVSSFNISVGYGAMQGDSTVTGTLTGIISIGTFSGEDIGKTGCTGLQGITYVGHLAGAHNACGSFNTVYGSVSFDSVGNAASGTTVVGADVAQSMTSGLDDTFIGFKSAFSFVSGNVNVCVGYLSCFSMVSSSFNVAVGDSALNALTTGNNNLALGPLAGDNVFVSGSNVDLIGTFVDTQTGTVSNFLDLDHVLLASATNAAAHITLQGADVAFAGFLMSQTATGVQLDVPNQIVTAIAVNAAGTGYAVGDIVLFGNGRYQIATVGGGGTIATISPVSTLNPTTASSPSCTTNCALQAGPATNASNSAGTGGTVNLTWGNLNGLTVVGASNKLAFYGATPIVKATPTGACAGSTGCQAIRDALGNLGLIATGSISN